MPGPATARWFVVPRRNASVLCTVDGGRLVEINPVPVPVRGECAVSASGWIAFTLDEGRAIGRAHVDAEPAEQRSFPLLAMPADYKAHTLAFAGDVLYVGGECGEEVLGTFDLAEVAPAWAPVEVPPGLRQQGKAMDDLLVDGDRLIAVDDIVYPKYLVLYDVADPARPRLREVRDIPNHGTYERIHTAALGENWLAILSGTFGRAGAFQHVALFDRESLHEHVALHGRLRSFDGPEGDPAAEQRDPPWHDVALRGDVLLLAAGSQGLGVLHLRHAQALGEDWRRHLVYREVRGAEGMPVVGVLAPAGLPQVLAVTGNDAGADTVPVDLPLDA
jgi:hypothetical protein